MSYQKCWVKCGKPRCNCCPHGPYWYHVIRRNGKLVKTYIGRYFQRAPAILAAEEARRAVHLATLRMNRILKTAPKNTQAAKRRGQAWKDKVKDREALRCPDLRTLTPASSTPPQHCPAVEQSSISTAPPLDCRPVERKRGS